MRLAARPSGTGQERKRRDGRTPPGTAETAGNSSKRWKQTETAGTPGTSRHIRTHGRGDTAMKRTYEAPTLVRQGSFRKKTGLLFIHGNDRIIFSKNG
jgi:hypothetical protein